MSENHSEVPVAHVKALAAKGRAWILISAWRFLSHDESSHDTIISGVTAVSFFNRVAGLIVNVRWLAASGFVDGRETCGTCTSMAYLSAS